jgi:hypothetical protein
MLSYAGDGAIEVTWPQHDVDVESCWRQCCHVMLVIVLQLKIVLAIVRLCNPQTRSIEVLSQCEEVELACQLSMIFVLAHS